MSPLAGSATSTLNLWFGFYRMTSKLLRFYTMTRKILKQVSMTLINIFVSLIIV